MTVFNVRFSGNLTGRTLKWPTKVWVLRQQNCTDGIPVEEEKERQQWQGFAEKERFYAWNESEWVVEN